MRKSKNNSILWPFLLVLEPCKTQIFFIVLSFLGIIYQGSESSPIYITIMVLTFFISFSIFTIKYFLNNKISLKRLLFIIIISIILVFGAFQIAVNHNYSYVMFKYFFFFWVFCFGSILWGTELGSQYEKYLPIIIKWFEVVAFFTALSSFIVILLPVMRGKAVLIYTGGVSYQAAAYYSAFSFGLILYYTIADNDNIRFSLFRSNIYKIVSYIFLFLLVICVIVTGGRGAFILMIIYTVLGLWYWIKKHKLSFKLFIMFLVLIILVPLIVIVLFNVIVSNETIITGFKRAISFIDFESGGINLSGTGVGRDDIYSQALSLIRQKPLTGYGLFEYMYYLTTSNQYPHNIFLELLLQGGVFYFTGVVIFLIYIFIKLKKLIHRDSRFWIILFIIIYPMTNLMFSATYLNDSLFWYCLAIIFSTPLSKLGKSYNEI